MDRPGGAITEGLGSLLARSGLPGLEVKPVRSMPECGDVAEPDGLKPSGKDGRVNGHEDVVEVGRRRGVSLGDLDHLYDIAAGIRQDDDAHART